MTPPRNSIGPGLIVVLALLAGGWFLQRGVAQEQNVYVQTRLLQEVADHIAERFVDPVDRQSLYESAIQGMIRGLGDPNTSLLTADDYETFRIQTEGDYGGVGLEIVDRDDYITVVSPLPGTPGARAGIRAGDEIVEVDGQSTRGWSGQQAVQVLRGRPGSDVQVRIRRSGVDEPIEFTLSRDRIQLLSVSFAALLDGGIGYIPLGMFSETSVREVRAAADSLKDEGASSLVLDLRGNPGGVLEQGIGIADLFLPRGSSVVETRGQSREQNIRSQASSPDRFEELNLVVLIDRGSASASEIVAGALQDHDRAVVVGSPSFGKGSVQSLFSLSGGNVLKMTTARWYTPRGRSIERPLEPDPHNGDDPEPETRVTLTVDGQFIPVPDTEGRPTVTSYAGRTLLGGGGIVPDLVVLPDTLAGDEQRAVRTLYRHAGLVNSAIFDHAVDFLNRNEVEDESWTLPAGEVDRLWARLEEKGVEVDPLVRRDANRFLSRQLEGEIASQAGGERARFLRRTGDDAVLRTALELLTGAESRGDLFVRAGTPLPEEADRPTEEAGR
jgi:carboxyl-terminal processing protease